MDLPDFLLVHQVVIEAYAGTTGNGVKQYAPPATVDCFVAAKRRLVRDPRGNQVVSETTVVARLDTIAPPESKVILPDGRTTTVITQSRADGGGLPTPDHVELALV